MEAKGARLYATEERHRFRSRESRSVLRHNGCGPGSSTTEGHGIGMKNTRERLAYFYPGAHEFQATAPAEGGYEVTIQIPYERATA
jgi:sensor histidine kinase YesM